MVRVGKKLRFIGGLIMDKKVCINCISCVFTEIEKTDMDDIEYYKCTNKKSNTNVMNRFNVCSHTCLQFHYSDD